MALKLESEVRKVESGVYSRLDMGKVNKNQVYGRFLDFSMRTPFKCAGGGREKVDGEGKSLSGNMDSSRDRELRLIS